MKELNFSDDVIATIAKVLQIAIITGTDIVDNLRMMRLIETTDGILEVTEDFKQQLEDHVAKMMEEVNSQNNLDEPPA